MRNDNSHNRINYKDNIIKKIRGFCFVMKYRSITKAAKFLYLTQPAISFQIQSLEKDLKLKLFKKEKNTITPTEDGYRFYHFAKNILDNFENLYQNFLKLDSDMFTNEIKIAGDSKYIAKIGVDFLNQNNFSKFIKIKFIEIDNEKELIDLFIKDFVDIIGVDEDSFRKLTIQRKDFIKIRQDTKIYGILVKKRDFINKKNKEIYDNIKNMNFIYNQQYEEKIKYLFEDYSLKKNIFLNTKNSNVLENLVENGYGWAFYSCFNVKKTPNTTNRKIKFIRISKLIKKEFFFSICKKNNYVFSYLLKK